MNDVFLQGFSLSRPDDENAIFVSNELHLFCLHQVLQNNGGGVASWRTHHPTTWVRATPTEVQPLHGSSVVWPVWSKVQTS